MEIPSIPPGFEPLVLFTLKRKKDNQVSYSRSASASETQNVWLKAEYDCNEDSKTTKSLSHRPCEKYNILENSFDDDLDSEQDILVWNSLPKGVIRGCDECNNCQKVTAKWHPEEAQRPDLEEAPVFYPTEEEFEDTLKYISSIRSEAEKYGICRIVPPPSWNPPCPLKERNTWEKSKFSTRVQRIDKLQNRDSTRKILHANHGKKLKKRRCLKNGVDQGNGIQEMKIKIPSEVGLCEAEKFGFETGPDFTLDAFQKYDDDFKVQYFRKNNSSTNSGGNGSMLEEQWQPSVEDIEGEYWRMVEKPTEEIEVLYGADLETGAFGSGFPKNTEQVASATDRKYITSGWNLNNFPRLPGSVLSFESTDISGVVVPWLYIGMCFSSFCWHVEDHHLYSLNYMHWGAPKVWYGVPGSDALKLEAAMRKYLPGLFEEQPDLLHKLVTQLSPSILRSEGVPVYRCIQNPGEFVLTFPRAFHAGFNCGFNCAEAVNVAPVDWLPHGQNAIELYREQGRQTSISHDKLLLGAAREAVRANWEYNLLRKCTSSNMKWKEVCGKDGILLKALKARVEMERVRREFLCKSSQALKMESSFDANSEKECSVCLFDLHLSAAGCHHCSPDKYACLNHAKQLCRCSWSAKFFLFRYDISELGMLVEALEGKLSAVYRWARLDLGLALSSYVSKDNMQIPGLVDSSQGSAQKDISSLSNVASSKEQKEQAYEGSLSSAKHNGSSHSSQNMKPPVVVLALANGKVPSRFCSQNVESGYKTSSCQVSQVNGLKISSLEIAASEKYEGKHSSFPENKDLIVLSDDEGDEPVKEPFVVNGTPQKHKRSAQKPVCADNMKNLDSCIDNLASTTTVTDPELPEGQKHGSGSVCIKVEEHAEAESYVGANPISSCCAKFPSSDAYSGKEVPRKVTPGCHEPNAECGSKRKHIDDETSKSEDGHKKLELDVELRSMNNTLTLPSTSAHQNNLDRSYRPKGPRIAKVVRRIKCNVESLNFGAVHPGKLWCDSHAIYPMGFRSRVRYIDVGAPTNMCYYVSEILDAGRDGPIFMVYVEQRPSEVFIHLSAGRCWEMVRERVNQVIEKHNKLAGEKLPPLQPPGSLDGMEMFGFSSPAIVQVIQAMDQNQVCTDYWKSRPLMQNPQQSQSVDNSRNLHTKLEPLKEKSCSRVERILHGLFRKANAEELHTLSSLLSNKSSTDDQSLLNRLLREEINKHPK